MSDGDGRESVAAPLCNPRRAIDLAITIRSSRLLSAP